MVKSIDLTDCVFGRLTVVKFDVSRKYGKISRRFWLCRCECGNTVSVWSGNLQSGNSKSCGCGRDDAARMNQRTHGLSNTFEHRIWKNMRRRCNAPTCRIYKHYGGRGIRVCERWDSFENFLADMGDAPSRDYSLERKDPDGHYCPENCIWIPKRKQSRNRRDTIRLTLNGETRALVEWSEHLGVSYNALRARHARGWDDERILVTPVRQFNRRK